MFERLYGAGDPATNGAWKNTITNNHPDVIDNSQVFDWRMALPGFVRLLGARLAIIGTMDQNFTTSGQWTPELGDGTSSFPGYRGVLTARLQQMIAGVRCDYKDRLKALGNPQTRSTSVAYDHTDVACADVNTGLNVITTYVRPDNNCGTQVWAPFLLQCLNNLPSTANMPSLEDGVRRQVLHQMPVFEMQSLIDALYLYTHPATDLTAGAGRIPLAANPGLCVDVPGANPAAGTQVQIYSCNAGTPQQFSYDREAATITNTALGNCLQVRPSLVLPGPWGTIIIDNLLPGAAAETSDCVSPTPDRQKWTYDPGAGTIRSALGTVLDVQWGVLQSGTPVWLWDYNGGGAQVWRADHSNDYCYNSVCSPTCQASCANAGPGTGSCMGGCLGGCMGNCMSTWP
jgi:hypothetical protein